MKWLIPITGVLVALIFALLIFLCFFQFPSMDDFAGPYLVKYYQGLGGAIKAYLTYGNGRFSSTPLFLTISSSAFLMDHYGFVLFFFILFALFSVFLFVSTVNARLFGQRLSFLQKLGISAVALIVFLTSIPELASFFFWMATSASYLFAFCIFLFLCSSYLILLTREKKHSWPWLAVTCFFTVFAAGCSELTLYYSVAIPLIIFFVHLVSGKRTPATVWFLIGFNILIAIMVMQIPGTHARAHGFIPRQSFLLSAVGAVYRTGQTLLPVFSNPLFYLSCLAVFIISQGLQPSFLKKVQFKRTNSIVESGMVVCLIFVFHFIARQFGNEIPPLRVLNIMNCISIPAFWFIILINSGRVNKHSWMPGDTKPILKGLMLVFVIALVFSSFTGELIKNVVAAPMHAQIIKQRLSNIQEAKRAGRHAVVTQPYDVEVDQFLEKHFPSKKRFIKEEKFLPPSFSYFMDEQSGGDAYFYAEFYDIDTIITPAGRFVRSSLKNHVPFK